MFDRLAPPGVAGARNVTEPLPEGGESPASTQLLGNFPNSYLVSYDSKSVFVLTDQSGQKANGRLTISASAGCRTRILEAVRKLPVPIEPPPRGSGPR
jgi:hypothetical protein